MIQLTSTQLNPISSHFVLSVFCTLSLFTILTVAQSPSLVTVDFYVMSKCPYAASLVKNFHDNVYTSAGLPGIMNITFNFIAQVCSDQPTGFCSKHGQDEVRGDWIELCTSQLNHDQLFPLVYCADQNYQNIPANIGACASSLGININPITNCVSANGKTLLTTSIQQTNNLGINASPNLLVNGVCMYGSLDSCQNVDPTTNQILQAVCAAYTGTQPAGCKAALLSTQ